MGAAWSPWSSPTDACPAAASAASSASWVQCQCSFPPPSLQIHLFQKLHVQTQTEYVTIPANAHSVLLTAYQLLVMAWWLVCAPTKPPQGTQNCLCSGSVSCTTLRYTTRCKTTHNMTRKGSVSREQCHRFGKFLVRKQWGKMYMLAGGALLFYTGNRPMLSSLFTFLGQLELENFHC